MFELIPSHYMRSLFKRLGFELTDFNKATIAWNMHNRTRDVKLQALKEIADTTSNAVLKTQIAQRIEYENKMLEVAKNNDGTFVYVVMDSDGMPCGFFAEYEMAYRYGIDIAKHNDEMVFSIEKQKIIRDEGDLMTKSSLRVNWNLVPESKENQVLEDYSGYPVASVDYAVDGAIISAYSKEMKKDDEDSVDDYNRERFEYQFIDIPFEGELGLQVCDLSKGTRGILMQNSEGWRNFLHKVSQNGFYLDYSDVQVEVVNLTPRGLWVHDHINPIYLEPEPYECEDDSRQSKAKARAMEYFSEYWFKKSENSNNLKFYEKRVIESSREYRDICLEEQVRQEYEGSELVDKAKTIEELIL